MSYFQSRDGTRLHERTWPAEGAAIATVLIVHGYGDHIGRYDEPARALAAAGFDVHGLDLRGHGQSDGARGFCNAFDEYLDDVDAAVTRARAADRPLFVLAHSFGALVAPHYALRADPPLAGLVLSSPYWKLALPVAAAKRWAGQLASRLFPRLALPTGLKGVDMSRDPEVQAAYEADPLINKNATARWFTEANQAQEVLFTRARALTLPCLIVAGEDDPVAAASHTRVVFDRLGATDKTLRLLPGQRHEVLNELRADRDKTIAGIVEWLRAHASMAATEGVGKLRAR